MKGLIQAILCITLAVSCAQHNNLDVYDNFNNRLNSSMDIHEKILAFQKIVDRNLRWRTDAISFYSSISNQTLYTNREILLLHEQGTNRYRKLRTELLSTINDLKWITDENVIVKFTNHATTVDVERYKTDEISKTDQLIKERIIVSLHPNDAKGKVYIKEAKIGLAAALLLYDNYLLAISHYHELKKTRQILNFDNQQYRRYLNKIASNYLNPENYRRTAQAISLFSQEAKLEQLGKIQSDEDNEYLNLLIKGSYTYDRISQDESIELLSGNIQLFSSRLADTLDNSSDYFTHYLGSAFSSVIGLIETRKGKMTLLDSSEKQSIAESLYPLDILLEKTPFRLTDKTIPGYWGHVAIWVGGKKDLERLGIWDHPLIKPHQLSILNENRHIIEALLPGVQINTLDHFLNIDDLAILRPVGLARQERQQAVLRAFAQLGKEYDYNFNVETNRRIVCSEIAYVVFNNYEWTTNRILGRATISPDNVVQFAKKTELFQTVQLYLNGLQIPDNLEMHMAELVPY